MQSRLAVRAWEYRQRHHARGVWDRLRRLLADSEQVLVVPPEVVNDLLDHGFAPHPLGRELHPPRTFIVLEASDQALLNGRGRPIAPSSGGSLGGSPGGELLAAQAVVLVRFPVRTPGRRSPGTDS